LGMHFCKRNGVHEYVADLISEKLGISTRSAMIGHIQRGGSPVVLIEYLQQE